MTHTIDPSQNFKPFVPEKTVSCIITKREVMLITELRKHQYGKFTIHKINGVLVRIETNESKLIEEDQ